MPKAPRDEGYNPSRDREHNVQADEAFRHAMIASDEGKRAARDHLKKQASASDQSSTQPIFRHTTYYNGPFIRSNAD
jgi:hypothetical protein